MEISENAKTNEKLNSDTFPAFATKALLVIESSLATPAKTAQPQKKRL